MEDLTSGQNLLKINTQIKDNFCDTPKISFWSFNFQNEQIKSPNEQKRPLVAHLCTTDNLQINILSWKLSSQLGDFRPSVYIDRLSWSLDCQDASK